MYGREERSDERNKGYCLAAKESHCSATCYLGVAGILKWYCFWQKDRSLPKTAGLWYSLSMSQIGWINPETGSETDFESALALAQQFGEWGGFPYEVLLGMYQQAKQEDRPDGASATQLIGCLRKVHLEKKHEYYSSPEDSYPAFRGVIGHSMLEKNQDPNSFVEHRVFRRYRGIQLSGQIDNLSVRGVKDPGAFLTQWLDYCEDMYTFESGGLEQEPDRPTIPDGALFVIRDWKTKDKLPTYQYVARSYQTQGNIYRWLLRIPTDRVLIEFVFVSMTGVKIMALYNGGKYANGRNKPQQVWADRQVENFLEERLVVLDLQAKYDKPIPYDKVPVDDLWNCQFCPARELCYRLAADEARLSFEKGESLERVTPRSRK